jgi:ST7 protein.
MKTNLTGTLPPFSEDALDEAQDITYDAWDEPNKAKRVALARKALRISPYCTDAYNTLAQDSAEIAERKMFYEKGVAVGELALGKEFFKENAGYFWGLVETRPYMRSLQGLAKCLWEIGERQESIEKYSELIRLNPSDNQGIRYILINCLIAVQSNESAEKLLVEYPENSAFLLYSAALLYFRQSRAVKARNALKKAYSANKHVPDFLLNPEKKYKSTSQIEIDYCGYARGEASEANEYRELAGEVWRETSGALAWLKESLS